MPAAPLLSPEDLARIDSLDLRARLIVEGFVTGKHRSPYHGFSVEFAQHRGYNPGDDLRHVDWKVFGRKDRLYLKQYEEETNLRHVVALDVSASMRYRGAAVLSKLEYGATLAASLHTLMVRQRDATGLALFSGAVDQYVPPRSTRAHLQVLLRTLAEVAQAPDRPEGARQTGLSSALHDLAERTPRRALVTLISDLFGSEDTAADLALALRHLRHRGHEVIVFHVLDTHTERSLGLEDAPVRLRDLETGEEVTLRPGMARDAYRAALDAYVEALRQQCLASQIDFVAIDTERPYVDALAAYLRKRARLY